MDLMGCWDARLWNPFASQAYQEACYRATLTPLLSSFFSPFPTPPFYSNYKNLTAGAIQAHNAKSPEVVPPPGSSICGAEGIRTPDLLSAIQALSQLSYSPLVAAGADAGRERRPVVQDGTRLL